MQTLLNTYYKATNIISTHNLYFILHQINKIIGILEINVNIISNLFLHKLSIKQHYLYFMEYYNKLSPNRIQLIFYNIPTVSILL